MINERGYRLISNLIRYRSQLILLLSVASIRRKLLKMSIQIQFDVFVLFPDPMVSSSSPHGAAGTTQECPWTDYMDSVEFKVYDQH